MRSAEFAVDKKLIARLDFNVVALLRSGRIGPAFAEIEPALVRRKGVPVCCERFRSAHNHRSGCDLRLFSRHLMLVSFWGSPCTSKIPARWKLPAFRRIISDAVHRRHADR